MLFCFAEVRLNEDNLKFIIIFAKKEINDFI